MDFLAEKKYIGHMHQLFSAKQYALTDRRGTKVIEISNGAGIDLTIIPDRGMDIYQVKFNGKNLNYIAPCGIVPPEDCSGKQFLEYFYAGFLTTCGLDNIGPPCNDAGDDLALHGWYTATAADDVTVSVDTIDGCPTATITGVIRRGRLFGGNMSLKRTIIVKYNDPTVAFKDEITNDGYRTEPFMILYHFNMGYPLLSEKAKIDLETLNIRPRTDYAKQHEADWDKITAPADGAKEMCYYHEVAKNKDGIARFGMTNRDENIALSIEYNGDLLDNFVQWKQLGSGEYAMGLEPCNATIEGRDIARKDGTLKFLEPSESRVLEFRIRLGECKQV